VLYFHHVDRIQNEKRPVTQLAKAGETSDKIRSNFPSFIWSSAASVVALFCGLVLGLSNWSILGIGRLWDIVCRNMMEQKCSHFREHGQYGISGKWQQEKLQFQRKPDHLTYWLRIQPRHFLQQKLLSTLQIFAAQQQSQVFAQQWQTQFGAVRERKFLCDTNKWKVNFW
jgi:hypothetical protein